MKYTVVDEYGERVRLLTLIGDAVRQRLPVSVEFDRPGRGINLIAKLSDDDEIELGSVEFAEDPNIDTIYRVARRIVRQFTYAGVQAKMSAWPTEFGTEIQQAQQ